MSPTELLNLSLLKLGSSAGIVDINEATRQAYTGRQVYDHVLRATLRTFPWPFATKYDDMTLVGGSEDTPVNGDWQYSYRWPDDCLFVRRIVPATQVGRAFDPNPIPFRIGRDGDGLLIYTDVVEDDAVMEYTTLDCDALFMDDLFVDALTWRIASYMAPALARDDKLANKCFAMYLQTINLATVVSSREGQVEKPGEAEWIRDR